jgi:hypothetical protein
VAAARPLVARAQGPSAPQNVRIQRGQSSTPSLGRETFDALDFSYLGHYDLPRSFGGTSPEWGQGFTHRYVDDELRFLTLTYDQGYRLIEFPCPRAIGDSVQTITGRWNDIWAGKFDMTGRWGGLWWDPASEQLWTTSAADYPDDALSMSTKSIHIRRLNANGTVSGLRGPFGLAGVGARCIYGGVVSVTKWFQEQFDVPPYVVGWGGYASRMAQGLPVSLGPTMYAIPDPTVLSDSEDVPANRIKVLMDHHAGSRGEDWYASGSPSSFDRGVRNSDIRNEYDGGNWRSPAPDGLGRWTWGDSAYNTGCWIDTPTKSVFLIVPSFSSGRAWYERSTLHCERRTFEIQLFNPALLAEVLSGARRAWDAKPSSRQVLSLPGLGGGGEGNGPAGNVAGATYDPRTQRLYLYGIWTSSVTNRIYVYGVRT